MASGELRVGPDMFGVLVWASVRAERDQRDERDRSDRIGPNQGESNQIKPACRSGLRLLTSAATPEGLVVVRLLRLIGAMASASRESRRIKPNQTESNQIKPNQTCGDGGGGQNWIEVRFALGVSRNFASCLIATVCMYSFARIWSGKLLRVAFLPLFSLIGGARNCQRLPALQV